MKPLITGFEAFTDEPFEVVVAGETVAPKAFAWPPAIAQESQGRRHPFPVTLIAPPYPVPGIGMTWELHGSYLGGREGSFRKKKWRKRKSFALEETFSEHAQADQGETDLGNRRESAFRRGRKGQSRRVVRRTFWKQGKNNFPAAQRTISTRIHAAREGPPPTIILEQ